MSAALLAKLIAAGTPAELVAEVAMQLARAEAAEKKLESKREYDREYQRERRTSRTTSYDSNDVGDDPSLDKEMPPRPPKEINPIPCVRNTRARAKHPLPANWRPMALKPDGQAGMIVARKPAGWIERQLSKFKDHALQNNRQCSDWNAAWRNWIKQADEMEHGRSHSLERHQSPDGLSATARAGLAVFGR
jgi:hypothetical protein